MAKRKYKVRTNCIQFVDTVVLAENKEKAKEIAVHHAQCDGSSEMEFVEFLDVEDYDKVDYED